MGGRGAVRAQGSARIFQALSRGTEMRRAACAFYAASQTLGRYRLACGVAGPQHGAVEDGRIHYPDGSYLRIALRNPDGSGDGRFAPAGCTRGEPRTIAAHRFDFAFARAFRSFRSGDAAQLGARGNGSGDGEVYQRPAARGAL